MSDNNPTIFGKILRGEIPSTRVWEDDQCIAFRDVNPVAPTHVLVIPRQHLATLNDATPDDKPLLGHLMWVATQIAAQLGVAEDGYRVVMNVGPGGGQTVFHIHLHIIAGRPLVWPPG